MSHNRFITQLVHIQFSWSTVSRHETITVLISICITDPYSCVCQLCAFVRMCACACVCVHVCVCVHACACVCVCVCVCTYVCVYICTCEFKYPIEYVKIYRSSGTFDTHSSLVIFGEHLVW